MGFKQNRKRLCGRVSRSVTRPHFTWMIKQPSQLWRLRLSKSSPNDREWRKHLRYESMLRLSHKKNNLRVFSINISADFLTIYLLGLKDIYRCLKLVIMPNYPVSPYYCTRRTANLDSSVLQQPKRHTNVYWTVHHCNSWRMKNQLDATCYFISLIMRSTCFGH